LISINPRAADYEKLDWILLLGQLVAFAQTIGYPRG